MRDSFSGNSSRKTIIEVCSFITKRNATPQFWPARTLNCKLYSKQKRVLKSNRL